ncbi:hypothetical protein M0805_003803 [Coniferiporia weirii]|nr:hypothetical protein M0805_003803 [Coniferiporia weirii]
MAQDGAAAVDLETLQAQVDLSMAVTNELVSSWIHPSLKTRAPPGAAIREAEKELQDLLRRPPRLGVGAPLPESAGASAREEAKLKYKLVGNDKKRARENGSEAVGKDDEDDEGDEKKGKGESSTKRARLDPFSASTKKKAKLVQELADVSGSASKPENGLVNGATVENSIPNGAPLDTPVQDKGKSPEGPENTTTIGSPPSPISAKKKKKKKKRKQPEQANSTDGVAGPSGTNVHGTISSDNLVTPENNTVDDAEEWTGFGDAVYDEMDLDNVFIQEKGEGGVLAEGEQNDSSPEPKGVFDIFFLFISLLTLEGQEAKAPSLSNPTTSSIGPLKSVARGTQPLLNLSGPPSDDLEDDDTNDSASPKKKRRRRKKNRPLGTEATS